MTPYSLDAYRRILRTALDSGYRVVALDEADDARSEERVIYLRHDVDVSMAMAVELARVNAEMGVCGTFFLLLRGEHYNLLSERELALARRIHEHGQLLGLHHAVPPGALAPDALRESVLRDHALLQEQLPMLRPMYAWHNTTPALLEMGLSLDAAPLVSAYSPRFFKDIPYYSDTSMRNSVERFLQVLSQERPPRCQLLFHPMNWVAGGASPIEIWVNTWARLLREREEVIRGNPAWSSRFPSGLPPHVIEAFRRGLLAPLEV